MTLAQKLRFAQMLIGLMWKYRGPLKRVLDWAYNSVEKWSRAWKNAGETVTSDEKLGRFIRLCKARGLTQSTSTLGKMAEDTWTRHNPRKAYRRTQGKTR